MTETEKKKTIIRNHFNQVLNHELRDEQFRDEEGLLVVELKSFPSLELLVPTSVKACEMRVRDVRVSWEDPATGLVNVCHLDEFNSYKEVEDWSEMLLDGCIEEI